MKMTTKFAQQAPADVFCRDFSLLPTEALTFFKNKNELWQHRKGL